MVAYSPEKAFSALHRFLIEFISCNGSPLNIISKANEPEFLKSYRYMLVSCKCLDCENFYAWNKDRSEKPTQESRLTKFDLIISLK